MKILLIITGSVAAYKACDLIRRLREQNHEVDCILTKGGEHFITPLQITALSGTQTHTDLWANMEHISLSRAADIIVVAPASADIMAKMAHGIADDLATSTLLAANKPIYLAPAMNVEMWKNPATQRNVKLLKADGIKIIEPKSGKLACGETGDGRMAEVDEIIGCIVA